MPYIDRDRNGGIVGIYNSAQFDGQEFTEEAVSLPEVSAVPQIVTRFQARAALHIVGLLPQVEALMSGAGMDPLALLAWTDAQEFKRSSPTLLGMASALGLTDQQLDELFITASEIEA